MLDGNSVLGAASVCTAALAPHATADWTTAVPDLEMTVAEVVAHAAEACLWYAIDLAAAGAELTTVEHRVKPEEEPGLLLDTMTAYEKVGAATIDAAPAGSRGFHPYGQADPSGFAAMACDELLVHTEDAARGLGVVFEPPIDLVAAVGARLFPWAAAVAAPDPWRRLLWANGRIDLPDRPRLAKWRWHCAPLGEWDGAEP